MTNLDSVLKSRDITLPTKVHIVKAMVSPMVMYGCESWTIKKVGWHHQLNGHEFEQTLGDSEGWESLACCNSWGHKGSDTTEQLN